MKTTDDFKKIIAAHLEGRAADDPLFAETLKKPNKNIDDCCTYILNWVKASGAAGFSDDEIFGQAVHYYDEDNIKVGAPVKATIVTNRSVKLTKKELAEAKEEARQKVLADLEQEQRNSLKKKPKKSEAAPESQISMFEL